MKKIAFSGFMLSLLMATGAAVAAGNATLTSQDYVDKGLRTLYGVIDAAKANKTDLDDKADADDLEELAGTVDDLSTAVESKADASDVYTKAEADETFLTTASIAGKANASDVYTKTEADETFLTTASIAGKANASDVYTKAEADETFLTTASIAGKANASDVYTKTEADETFLTPPEIEENEDKMFLYTSDGWSEITVKDTFPDSYNFGG